MNYRDRLAGFKYNTRVDESTKFLKLASKRYRHRAALLIHDGQGRVYAQRTSPKKLAEGNSRIGFPGGGIHENESEFREPTREEILSGARKEALEELGVSLKNPKIVGSHHGGMEDWWKDNQEKKRGVRFDGAKEHYVLAQMGEKDDSLYDTEGDAFKGDFHSIDKILPDLKHDASRNSAFSPFNKEQLRLIRKNIEKSASKKSDTNSGSTLKDILLVGGGTALGAGAGYGLGAFMKKRYGAAIKGADPRARLKWLVPAGAAAGGALALTQVLRQQSGRKSKK